MKDKKRQRLPRGLHWDPKSQYISFNWRDSRGKQHGQSFTVYGASGSAKEGKFYLVDADHAQTIAERFQFWPEAATVYFGILVSPCRVMIDEPDMTVLVVEDHQLGTNDCRGWIRRSLFGKLQLPDHCLYQFRMAFEDTRAKGSLKVMGDDVADMVGADVIVPTSSIKPELKFPKSQKSLFQKEGKKFRGRVVLGIRDVSEPRTYGSSYQLIENAPDDSIQLEVMPEALQQVRKFADSLEQGDYTQLLEILCLDDAEAIQERTEMRIVEAALMADQNGIIV